MNGYTLKIYNGDKLLDTYNITANYIEYLEFTDLVVDKTNLVIKNIAVNTIFNSILDKINTTGEKRIIDSRTGSELSSNDKIKTGDKIEIKMNNKTYTYLISVKGDANGDGNININDLIILSRHITKVNIITENIYMISADVNDDSNVNINDIIKLSKYIIKNTEL